MRTLATILLLFGVADLVAINAVIGPAALADEQEGVGGWGLGVRDRTVPAEPPPLALASVRPESPTPPPAPVATPVPVPVPDPVPVPETPSPAEHPDSAPRRLTIHFDLDSDRLGRSATAALDRAAADLEARPDLTVEISGHADESGSEEYNQSLSERRAQAVVDFLQERGVEATRLVVHAFGELKPLDPDRERARRNRRVELHFVSPDATGDPR